MLKRFGEDEAAHAARIPIGEASYPAPFAGGLEFNAPVHGTWNIVHTGMLIPDARQVFVCPANCMRGVVLTAAEMNAADRFSQVVIAEKDVLCGSVEQLTVDGVCDALEKLHRMPRAVLVYTVCMHHFLGCDLDWIYRELQSRLPQVTFVRCFMDPIMRKSGLTPDEKMRRSLYEPIEALPVSEKTVCLLGSDFASDPHGDLRTFLDGNGIRLLELPRAKTYDEYLATGESALFLSVYPAARPGAQALSRRLGRPHLHLPLTFDYGQIMENERRLAGALGLSPRDPVPGIARAQEALADLKEAADGRPVAIDYTLHPRPLGLSRLLLDHGIHVATVYLDAVSAEEEADFYYLQKRYPQLELCATVHPQGRVRHHTAPQTLALGQKAAWFTGSRHFVNVAEGAGWYGFDGICACCAAAMEALKTQKDPADLLPRKGLGCESCL